MLNKIKSIFKKETPIFEFPSPLAGEVVPIEDVNDSVFSEKMVGDGVAIRPTGNEVVSPVEGKISTIFETGHAVVIEADNGLQFIIHIGLDTVNLKGKHFKIHKQKDDIVKTGDLLIEFDLEAIKAEGYDVITPVVIANHKDYDGVVTHTGIHVEKLDKIMTIYGEKLIVK